MRHQMPKVFVFAACLILGISCDNTAAQDSIKIGWIGPLTGPAAVLGIDSMPAARLAVSQINGQGGIGGRALQLVVEDDKYISSQTVSAYRKMVKLEGVRVIIVVSYSGLFAISPLAEQDNVVLIDPLDCDKNVGALPRHTLCIAKKTEDLGLVMADDILRRRLLRVGVLYFDGDAFMGTVAKALEARLKQKTEVKIFSTTYDNSITDFKSHLLRLQSGKPEALALLGYDQLGTALKQARELGLANPAYLLSTLVSEAGRKLAGDAAEGARIVLWTAPPSPALDAFRRELQKSINRPPLPDVFVTPTYDSVRLVTELLRKGAYDPVRKDIDTGRLLELLYATRSYTGISGTFGIDEEGMARGFGNIEIKVFRNGRLTDVKEDTHSANPS